MLTYLACFDISDDRSRRVAAMLEEYGLRVQRSVFEISVSSKEQLEGLRKRLLKYIDEEDDLRFYHLCSDCRGKSADIKGKRIAQYPLVVLA